MKAYRKELTFSTTRRRECISMLLPLAFCSAFLPAAAQKTGTWRDHFAYTQGVDVMPAPEHVVCATSAGLLFFNGELTKISKVNGLSDFGITAAMYDAAAGALLLGYGNGNLDVLRSANPEAIRQGGQTLNLSAWKDSRKPGAKRVNRFLRTAPNRYLVATGSRILEVAGSEIVADFTIDNAGDTLAVRDLAMHGSAIVAATAKGLFAVEKSSPQLHYYGSWQHVLDGAGVASLAVSEGALYALLDNGALLASTDLQSFAPLGAYANPRALSVAAGALWLSAADTLHNVFTPQESVGSVSPVRAAAWRSHLCIADAERGLLVGSGQALAQHIPNGPQRNEVAVLTEQKGKVVAAGSGALSVLEPRGAWLSVAHSELADVNAVKVNPQNAAEILVATSDGAVRFSHSGNALTYLEKSLQGSNLQGMDADPSGTLLAFAAGSATPVKQRHPDGSWSSLPAAALRHRPLGRVAVAGRVFWGVHGADQMYAYSAGTTAGEQAAVFPITPFSVSSVLAIAADRNHQVWLGTNQGVLLYPTTSPFAATPDVQRVKIPNEIPGRASYLLEYEQVTAVAVDGGNRKWFGTRSAGAFLQSPDGHDEVHAFHALNSPLPSNRVVSIAVNSQTGEVIFATDKGMVGYYGEATAGAPSFNEVKAFPNPVRPNAQQVTITNLMEDASVRITDMAGNLVFFGTASGGTVTWDTKNLSRRRVATGVYLIFSADQSGQETRVVKLLVVN